MANKLSKKNTNLVKKEAETQPRGFKKVAQRFFLSHSMALSGSPTGQILPNQVALPVFAKAGDDANEK